MEDWQYKLYAQIQSIVVIVEGMKAENAACVITHTLPKYRQTDFDELAAEMTAMAMEMIQR